MDVTIRRRYDEMKALKAENGMTSQNALRLVKVREDYTGLRDQVVQDLRSEGMEYEPSVDMISHLCVGINESVEKYINSIQAIADGKFVKRHMVRSYNGVFQRLEMTGGAPFVWNFDYRKFIVKYFREFRKYNDHKKAFAGAVIDFLKDRTSGYLDDGKRKMTPGDVLSWVFNHENIGRDTDRLPFSGKEEILEEILEKIMRRLGKDIAIRSNVIKNPEDIPTIEKYLFLYDDDARSLFSYNRAKREGTLRRLEVERMIALGAVVGTPTVLDYIKETGDVLSDPEMRVSSAVNYHVFSLAQIRNFNNALSMIEDESGFARMMSAVDGIASSDAKTGLRSVMRGVNELMSSLGEFSTMNDRRNALKEYIERTEYTLRALKLNRKWLKEMLEQS